MGEKPVGENDLQKREEGKGPRSAPCVREGSPKRETECPAGAACMRLLAELRARVAQSEHHSQHLPGVIAELERRVGLLEQTAQEQKLTIQEQQLTAQQQDLTIRQLQEQVASLQNEAGLTPPGRVVVHGVEHWKDYNGEYKLLAEPHNGAPQYAKGDFRLFRTADKLHWAMTHRADGPQLDKGSYRIAACTGNPAAAAACPWEFCPTPGSSVDAAEGWRARPDIRITAAEEPPVHRARPDTPPPPPPIPPRRRAQAGGGK
eukprot:TRINITY_DN3093_c0_g1_i1.p2 TRINITY_DN3093_c0_g1~~TRINITY_DN3093_c0_g1_i1.p2  ORF type:complete len:288 (+),score=113.37 TRINITY_DN3093_c0_g1_i1:84-866(+)